MAWARALVADLSRRGLVHLVQPSEHQVESRLEGAHVVVGSGGGVLIVVFEESRIVGE